jgi:rRNA biogenesis protein RRP5
MAPPRGDRKRGKPDLRPDRKQFKKNRKEVAAEQGEDGEQQQPSSAALLAAAEDDVDFPRGRLRTTLPFGVHFQRWHVVRLVVCLICCAGGRSLLSRDEVAEARAEAEAEFDKEGRKGKGKRKRKGGDSSGFDADDDLGTLFGGATTGKLPRFANRITLKVSFSQTLLLSYEESCG